MQNILQCASETIYRFTLAFLIIFFMLSWEERAFQCLNWIVGWSTSIYLQMEQKQNPIGFKSGDEGNQTQRGQTQW